MIFKHSKLKLLDISYGMREKKESLWHDSQVSNLIFLSHCEAIIRNMDFEGIDING